MAVHDDFNLGILWFFIWSLNSCCLKLLETLLIVVTGNTTIIFHMPREKDSTHTKQRAITIKTQSFHKKKEK